jgi:putative ABC transport system ATP-binding protein
MPDHNTAVLLNNVSRIYRGDLGPGYEALKGVELRIGEGECVALIGQSGSGKTTILNLIGGIDRPDSGTVEVAGRELAALDDNALSRYRLGAIGYVFQSFNLLPHLTVAENIAVPLLLAGSARGAAMTAAREAADSVEMGSKTGRRPYELSGGEMQRVAIARATVHKPAIVLADEPTGNLDTRTGEVILTLLARMNRERGVTLLIATHSEQALAIAQRVVRIQDGRIVGEGRR